MANDLYSLLMADEPNAAEQAQALAAAIRGQKQLGTLGALTGDRVLGQLGQTLTGDAGRQEQALQEVAGTRLQRALQRQQMAQQQVAQQADEAHRAAQLGISQQELALRKRQLAQENELARAKMDQDAFGSAVDPVSGRVVIFNKKTGQKVPDQAVPGGSPGGDSGLKPQQFWTDVQEYGKEVEPLAKAAPDIAALRAATGKDDVAGFGPMAGKVPNMLMSDEGVGNRQAAGRLMAAIIQATSGQAASEKEVDRLLEANGMGRTATTPQLRLGVEKLATQYENLMKQRQARFHPSVVQTFEERGGFKGTPPAAPPANTADLRKKYGL